MFYCPKCEKRISPDRIAEINRKLKAQFGKSALESGQCPVCSTPLLDLSKKEAKK